MYSTQHGDEYYCMAGNKVETASHLTWLMQTTVQCPSITRQVLKDKEYRMCWEEVCKNHMNLSLVMGMVTNVVVLVYFKAILYHV